MKNTFVKKIGAALAILMLTMFSQVWIFGQEVEEKQSMDLSSVRQRTIEGVWRTVVTPRDCQTGLPVAPAFRGLFTFNEGGTMSEYGISPSQSPALRSPGHGVWEQRHGRRNYSFKFVFYRYDASGVFIGSQKITAVLELGAGGDGFTTSSALEIFDADDNLIRTGCPTSVGTRFE